MGQALAIRRYTPQEYYTLEREAQHKSEFIHGEIHAMAGGSSRHSLIKSNLIRELGNRLKGKPCAPYDGDQRLRIKDTGMRAYPDAAVYCDKMEYDPEDNQAETATNPTVLFEVLSDSTERYDRGPKWSHYQRIESLKAYVLVQQHMPMVEMLHRNAQNEWVRTDALGLDGALKIPCLGIELSLAEIYDRLTWDGPGQTAFPLTLVE
jgi:Uma2 family endonuclease